MEIDFRILNIHFWWPLLVTVVPYSWKSPQLEKDQIKHLILLVQNKWYPDLLLFYLQV